MQPHTAAAGVVAQLRERILSGRLRPGMTLPPERVLANQLAVSRATLREGLSILSQMGLVSIQPGRGGGSVVTAPPATTVSSSIALLFHTRSITAGQLCEFRRALEVEAAQLAASRRTSADLTAVHSALEAYATCGHDAQAQNVHGRAFHYAVAEASGNPLLAETMGSINDAFAECFAVLHEGPDEERLIRTLHEPILHAIQQHDPAAARQAMQRHFDQLDQVLHDLGLREHPIVAQSAQPGTHPAPT